jgi:Tol biopolymer transport system component
VIAFTARAHPGEPRDEGSPDGAGAIVVSSVETKAEGAGWLDGKRTSLYLLSLATGQITPLVTEDFDVAAPSWSPCGQKLAFIAKLDRSLDGHRLTSDDIVIVDLETGTLQPIPTGGSASQVSFSPDGRYLAYVGNDQRFASATQNDLYLVPIDGGEPGI